MNESKNLLTRIGETIDQYRIEQRSNGQTGKEAHFRRILRWLLPNGGTILLALILILTQNVWAKPLQSALNAPGPSATTINYQGRLADSSGNPKDGTFGMTFAFYDADTGGSPVWGPESHAAVPVSDGLFSVGLGSQTSGGIPTSVWNGDRYLEITVGGETLSPRELIRSVPVAGMALTVPDGAIGTEQIADGAVSSSKLVPTVEKVLLGLNGIQLTDEYQTLASTVINVETPSSVWLIATCDCKTSGGAFITAKVIMDGISPPPGSGHGIFAGSYPPGNNTIGLRQSVSNNYVFDLEPGSHTIEFQARLIDSTGSGEAGNHTGFSYMVVGR